MKRLTLLTMFALLLVCPMVQAQFAGTGTTTVSVTVGAEASLSVTTSTTNLTTVGAIFTQYTGTTNLSYKIRTLKVGGNGSITAQVTSDFGPAGGPSVATPPTAGDALNYTCTVSLPGTGCTGTILAKTTSTTNVATFGTAANSASAGNTASTSWTLTNDPLYATGTYTSTVTYTISAA